MANNAEKMAVVDIILTPAETAQLLKVSLPTVYRMIQRGEIKTMPISGHVRIYGDQFFSDPERAQQEMKRRIWGEDIQTKCG